MTDQADLQAAYRVCREVSRRNGRTYHLAASLLPASRRPHVWSLYAFARTADDLVDVPTGDPAQALKRWEAGPLAALHGARRPDPVADPVTAAAWTTMRAFDLDPGLWDEFATSMRMDLSVTRYPTFADLQVYMRGSAAVIGELMAPVLGAADPGALEYAGRLGEAFQLTNFVRDVAEDHLRGRIYLPQADLAVAGVTEEDLADAVRTARPSPAVRLLIDLEVDRALAMYEQARPGIRLIAPWARPCLEAAHALYRDIAVRIRAGDGDVFSGRVTVPQRRRVVVAGRLVSRSVWHRARTRPRT